MKILVTGGAGFIGSNFVLYWLSRYPQDKVVVVDKLTYAGNINNLLPVRDKIEFLKNDICNLAAMRSAMRGCDAVVHFAAESHVDRSVNDPMAFMRTNVLGTQTLLDVAREQNIRFHHVSTDEVFGSIDLDDDYKWDESSPYQPRSPYAASKAGSDHAVRAAWHTHGVRVTITNCANNFGPYMFPEKLLSLAIVKVMNGQKVPIYGSGRQVREWLWVEDHCRAIDLVLRFGKIGETYFVGPDHPEVNNFQLIQKLLKIMKVPADQFELVPDRPGHDQKYALDSSKVRTELGWVPQVDLDEGLATMVAWYKQNEGWWRPLLRTALAAR